MHAKDDEQSETPVCSQEEKILEVGVLICPTLSALVRNLSLSFTFIKVLLTLLEMTKEPQESFLNFYHCSCPMSKGAQRLINKACTSSKQSHHTSHHISHILKAEQS